MTDESSRAVGRPSKYKSDFCEMLIEHMSNGLSFESFAGVAGVSRAVLYDWEKAHEEFLDAKEVGTEKSRMFWETLGIKHIVNASDSYGEGQSSSRSLNASVWIFNMKNRFKWRDKQPDEIDVVINNNVKALTDEELEQRIQNKLNK